MIRPNTVTASTCTVSDCNSNNTFVMVLVGGGDLATIWRLPTMVRVLEILICHCQVKMVRKES